MTSNHRIELTAQRAAAHPDRSAVQDVGAPRATGAAVPGWWRADEEGPMDEFLKAAVAEAEAGLAEGGIPIGSVLVHEGQIIGRGHNRRVQRGSAILHGEMDALENAGRLSATVYARSVLYTTLSPCAMCSGAILLYRIPRIVVGENVTFGGEEDLLRDRGVAVNVLQDARCIEMMRQFILAHPAIWNEDIGV
jgi:cytosine deaminase